MKNVIWEDVKQFPGATDKPEPKHLEWDTTNYGRERGPRAANGPTESLHKFLFKQSVQCYLCGHNWLYVK